MRIAPAAFELRRRVDNSGVDSCDDRARPTAAPTPSTASGAGGPDTPLDLGVVYPLERSTVRIRLMSPCLIHFVTVTYWAGTLGGKSAGFSFRNLSRRGRKEYDWDGEAFPLRY